MAYNDKSGIIFNTFNNSSTVSNSVKKKLSNWELIGASVDDLADIANDNGGVLPTTINSVEIDWNGADLGNSYQINTTGEKNAI